jgi:hypothetical protein
MGAVRARCISPCPCRHPSACRPARAVLSVCPDQDWAPHLLQGLAIQIKPVVEAAPARLLRPVARWRPSARSSAMFLGGVGAGRDMQTGTVVRSWFG